MRYKQQEIHEYEALRGGLERRLYCWLTSLSQSLQTFLRTIIDSTAITPKMLLDLKSSLKIAFSTYITSKLL